MRKERTVVGGVFTSRVVIDTREQIPYTFESIAGDVGEKCDTIKVDTIRGKLTSGDYSLEGHESKISVERKSLSDLYSTIGHGRENFEEEFQRLNELNHAFVVIEADWSEVLNPPESITDYTDLPPKVISRTAISWRLRYPRVHWLPCGSRDIAEATTFRILEMYLRTQLKDQK